MATRIGSIMSIAENLKISKFSSEYHKMIIHLIYTSNAMMHELEKRASVENITVQQFNVLRILRGKYPEASNNNLIKERMIEKMSDVSRMIDRLVNKGLVTRKQSKADKRAVSLLITQKGLDVLARLEEPMLMHDFLQKKLSLDECVQLTELLEKLND